MNNGQKLLRQCFHLFEDFSVVFAKKFGSWEKKFAIFSVTVEYFKYFQDR
jgi:hypothetical protein